jgi:hypothetical protein
MSEVDPLLEAVEALTKPVKRKQLQDVIEPYTLTDKDGIRTEHRRVIGTQKVTVELPPLLELLDDAIQSSMGGSTKGAALASESIPLNSAALFEAMKISSQVRDWCRLEDVTPTRHTLTNLRAWYVATRAGHPTPDEDEAQARVLRKWAATIRGMLDPWREKDLPDPCPLCGAKLWWDPAEPTTQGRPRPLIIRYRPGDADMVERAYGLCRACEEVFGVRELAYAIEHAAEATG